METIFIQIASYKDPQLIPTIEDCLLNATDPARLRFGICNQTDDLTELTRYSGDHRFRVTLVAPEESNGVCWARNLIQTEHYENETYTLHLDAHHRFVSGWDEKLITMIKYLQSIGHNKPLLTTYAPHFDPSADPEKREEDVWVMNFDRFIPQGAVFFMPHAVTEPAQLKEPIPARFYSAHFAFTLGQMCHEVPHDPNYYFHGEEINVGVRAYTHGYDLFHPHELILWHCYTRKRTTHWQDHHDMAWELDQSAHRRNRILFGMAPNLNNLEFGQYGFGTERSLGEYERYAGLRFKNRTVQRYTLQNRLAPNPPDDEWVCEVKHIIKLPKEAFAEGDYELWRIEFYDAAGKSVDRKDVNKAEIDALSSTESPLITIDRKFITNTLPIRWILRQYSAAKGWSDRMEGTIAYQ